MRGTQRDRSCLPSRLRRYQDRRQGEDSDKILPRQRVNSFSSAPVEAGALSPLSVTQVTRIVKRLIEGEERLSHVAVLGEIFNFKRHTSGHIYFSLKDKGSVLNCVFFRGRNSTLTFKPAEGMEVIAEGQVQVYEKGGRYQLNVARMIESGTGALYRKYEEIKKRLVAEGLTSADRKRPLPPFPRRIGLVFSRDSAGLRDILKVLRRRYPLATVLIRSVPVEGAEAAPEIVRGLREIAERGGVDVVAVGRGGGSIESLWAFNSEEVARTIAGLPMPVVTAIGHETDTTIADLVADRRAATPTEAAELMTPSREELLQRLESHRWTLRDLLVRRIESHGSHLSQLRRILRSPGREIDSRIQRISELLERLHIRAHAAMEGYDRRLERAGAVLMRRTPRGVLMEFSMRLQSSFKSLAAGLRRHRERHENRLRFVRGRLDARKHWKRHESRLGLARARLDALNPTAILRRGYAVVFREGRSVRAAAEVAVGERVDVRLFQGGLRCRVEERKVEE
ncbi:MAG: exodeoxyribonuclease VII large subunit [Candidatus Hydrogenedentota bacterium]|nr:MAG: exodeoxyribonuclease VII large subunit [Candidatus Hydrogenedentota bacterium]